MVILPIKALRLYSITPDDPLVKINDEFTRTSKFISNFINQIERESGPMRENLIEKEVQHIEDLIKKLLRIDPDDLFFNEEILNYHLLIGRLCFILNACKDAISCFEKALDIPSGVKIKNGIHSFIKIARKRIDAGIKEKMKESKEQKRYQTSKERKKSRGKKPRESKKKKRSKK